MQSGVYMEYLIIFLIGGIAYNILEYLWRGFSHWTMTIDGGLCLVGIVAICTGTVIPFVFKVIACALFITAVEFVSGIIINKILRLNVWDYSAIPHNILGQICLRYTLLWTALCIPLTAVITLIATDI